ncbi:calcium-activated chloride channel regulator 1-like isoform X1 [Hemibagrus wyckioides]|uniref:calcium-activated chloride channel regulator 1-like isoform X1 n=1 Tax=Hemibagrus wyckioides TaxID=337641 RepID=UPI00266BF78B|nr:calcium-activated chloride channel regulator 1-like isoform X1 [Hemibagrus wyckioides]
MVKMLAVVLLFLSGLGPVTTIRLDGNGYTDILIVISPSVPENEDIINQIKEMIVSGSEFLFEALDHKLYFKEVKILVPPNWTTGKYERATTECFDKGRIRIDNANSAFGDEPYTPQVTGCGTEAQYIHFTPKYLLDKDLYKNVYGPKGRVFVHEWAHLRWGVFDEYNKNEPFYLSAGQNKPTRCSDKILGETLQVINQSTQSCWFHMTGLPTSSCKFFPNVKQITNVSIMYSPSMDSVRAFCNEEEHNAEAPNEQNSKCKKLSTRTVIFQESVDKDALHNLKPLPSPPPAPTFRVLQRGTRVVCLVLDVSGSMANARIKQQQQSASVFLNHGIQEQQFVALVTFSTKAKVLSPLTLIDGQATRDKLIHMLPTNAQGSTNICEGLREGFKVLRKDDNKTIGDEIIFLTDGEATDNIQECLQEAVQSGSIIHTISFGPKADSVLKIMADQTGGKFYVVPDSKYSYKLVNVFSSLTLFDGNPMTQPIQLESTEKVDVWLNGTVPIDRTVGNQTTFIVTYETSAPTVYLQSPSGLVYDQRNTSDIANTITLTVPGTAEPGDWKYMFLSEGTAAQAISLIVISQAAHEDVYPVTVTVRMIQETSDDTKPLLVLAEVAQNYNPVLGASVSATLESDEGQSVSLQLLDNGAGADSFKGDGTYSRYLTKILRGKYSLKVRVENQHTEVQFPPYRHSGALYIPGYVDDGEVKLNPPEPPINLKPVDVGSFIRTVTGQSFVVEKDISINFPPNMITDLIAELQEDTVILTWTAPGEDYDLGRAKSYEIRWSEDFKTIQYSFSSTNLVNTSGLVPQTFGSPEKHTFQPSITLQHHTTLFIAIQSVDQQAAKSEISNIARVTKYVPTHRPPPSSKPDLNLPPQAHSSNPGLNLPPPTPSSIPGLNLTAIIFSLGVMTIVVCLIAVVITWVLKRRTHYIINRTRTSEMSLIEQYKPKEFDCIAPI